MSSSIDPSKSAVLNLRVLDQDIVEGVVAQLQRSLDKADDSAKALVRLIEQSAQAPDVSLQLDERLRVGMRMIKALQSLTGSGADFIAELESRQLALKEWSERAVSEAKVAEARLGDLEAAAATIEQKLAGLEREASAKLDARMNSALDRAQRLVGLIENAEANVAVRAMRTALNGDGSPAPRAEIAVSAKPEAPASLRQAANAPSAMPVATTADALGQIGPLQPQPPVDSGDGMRIADDSVAGDVLHGIYEEMLAGLEELSNASEALRGTQMSETQRQHLERGAAFTSALRDIVNEIPRLATRNAQSEQDDFDLRQTIESVAGHLTKRAKDRGLTLTCEVEPDVPACVRGDSARLRQILMYVINGSIKLANRGEILVRASLEGSDGQTACVCITVTQTGASSLPQQLDDLLQLTPGDAVPSPTGRSGMGLVIARQLVERLGGQMGMTSGDDRFSFWFRVLWQRRALGDARRSANRLRIEAVDSNLGPVLDLSLSGARIMSAKKLEGQVELQLSDEETTVTLQAEVIWAKRVGWRKHEIGVRFLFVSSDATERITRICMHNRVRRTLDAA